MTLQSADCRWQMGVRAGALACAVVLATAGPALAQRANGPFAGAFGPQQNPNRVQGLDLSASFFGAYDRNQFPESEAADRLDPRLKESGLSGGLAGTLTYERRGDRARFMASGGGSGRRYATSSTDQFVAAYQAGTALSANVGPRVTFDARADATYSPFFQFAPFLESGIANVGPLGSGFGFAAVAERNLGLDASVGLTGNLTRRTSVFGTVDGRQWRLLDRPQDNLTSWGARAGVRHRLARGFGVHLGYGRDRYEYGSAGVAAYDNETIDAGVDYGDTLTFARRTALSFSTATVATRYGGETHYRLNGAARLTRGFGRSWSSWVGYDRETEFRIGFRAPLLTDSVNAGVGGLVAWRVRGTAGAGYTRGTIGFSSDDFSVYSGTTRLDLALTRRWALFGQYAYYHYQVPQGSSTLDLIPRFSRQVATVGLSLSLPLVNEVRAPKPQQQP